MVRALNLEISEVVTQVTNAFHESALAAPPAPEADADTERAALAFERTRAAMGPVMAELLATTQHAEDPLLVDIALKADMVGFAAEIASAWDFQHQSQAVFTGVYKQMLRSEPHPVAGQWRAHAQKYSKQRLYNGRDLAPGFAHQLAERIADLLTVCGAPAAPDAIYALYAPRLLSIVRTALALQRAAGEDVTACDYEVLVARFDEPFDAARMEDIYSGELAADADAAGAHAPRVLTTADLGLRRVEKVPGSAEGELVCTMLLKPKVVLDTVIYELGLLDDVDEDGDAPPEATAEETEAEAEAEVQVQAYDV
ncbi:hypothetical protein OH77DRAFT_1406020 [Trametes cingulata]|nr:hypothetical protein OH77DRAFT_1406020 [Trametes cingulata]